MGCAQSAALDADTSTEVILPCEDGNVSPSSSCPARAPFKQGSLSEFHLMGKLGQGAYATVHMARSAQGSTVAIKVTDLRQPESEDWEKPTLSDSRRHAVRDEIRIMTRLVGRDHIVQLLGSFQENSLAFMVMEKCDGTLLQAMSRLHSIDERSVCRILREMLMGIRATHAAGVVHRDIKPDNFLCSGPGDTIKLCDFGLALAKRRQEEPGVFGTPPFICPEMLDGKPYDTMVDMWSFGVIVYSLFFGRFPYEPATRTAKAMKETIRSGVPAPSYSVSAQCADAGCVSRNARDFAAGLLSRPPAGRLSAEAALLHPFFQRPGKTNLEPMLKASTKFGAFCVVQRFSRTCKNEVDYRIEALQAVRLHPCGEAGKTACHRVSDKATKSHDSCDEVSTNAASDASTTHHGGLQSPLSMLTSSDRSAHEEPKGARTNERIACRLD
mmetsp:Transcript_115247/g.332917  ORF Transcript_115247/g.332917 Transcript_115247/m.332917 type:complete len:441 (-) Transcript_115247:74-1396(-)